MSNTIDSQILSNRARAERASVSAAASEDVAVQAKDQSMAALADVLSTAGVDADYISYTVGSEPPAATTTGTIGAYFKEEGLFQKVEGDGSEWQEIGEVIVGRKYVDDKALSLTDEIDNIAEGQRRGFISYATKSDMDSDTTQDEKTVARVMNDPTPSNNGYYRFDGTDWIKGASLVSGSLDPQDEDEAVSGRATDKYLFENLTKLQYIENGWERGSLLVSDGSEATSTSRIRSSFIFLREGAIIGLSDYSEYKFRIYEYDTDREFIRTSQYQADDFSVKETGYVRVLLAYEDDREISSSDISYIGSLLRPIDILAKPEVGVAYKEDLERPLYFDQYNTPTLELGSFNNSTGEPAPSSSNSRLRTIDFIPVRSGTEVSLSSPDHYIRVYEYSLSKELVDNGGGLSSGSYTAPRDCYIKILFAYADDREVSSTDIEIFEDLIGIYKSPIASTVSIDQLDDTAKEVLLGVSSSNLAESISWEIGSFYIDTGMDVENSTRIRTGIQVASKGMSLSLVDYTNHEFMVVVFSLDDPTERLAFSAWDPVSFTMPCDGYYRVLMRKLDQSEISPSDFEEMPSLFKVALPSPVSRGPIIAEDLSPSFVEDDPDLFDGETTSVNDMYGAFDALAANYPDYISKEVLSEVSGGFDMNQYTFSPPGPVSNTDVKNTKVIITCGVHGDEKGAVYALYNMMRRICNDWRDNTALEFFRFNVEFIIVPICNPSGFETHDRRLPNNVDLNRNFPVGWLPDGTAPSGSEPFSEIESQVIDDMLAANQDATFFIDLHNFRFHIHEMLGYTHSSSSFMSESHIRMFNTLGRKYQGEYAFFDQSDTFKWAESRSHLNGSLALYAGAKYGFLESLLEVPRQITWESQDPVDYSPLTQKICTEMVINLLTLIFRHYRYGL